MPARWRQGAAEDWLRVSIEQSFKREENLRGGRRSPWGSSGNGRSRRRTVLSSAKLVLVRWNRGLTSWARRRRRRQRQQQQREAWWWWRRRPPAEI